MSVKSLVLVWFKICQEAYLTTILIDMGINYIFMRFQPFANAPNHIDVCDVIVHIKLSKYSLTIEMTSVVSFMFQNNSSLQWQRESGILQFCLSDKNNKLSLSQITWYSNQSLALGLSWLVLRKRLVHVIYNYRKSSCFNLSVFYVSSKTTLSHRTISFTATWFVCCWTLLKNI